MKFKTSNGESVRLALLTGHVALVGPTFEELDDRFHAAAYSSMCISEDMLKSKASNVSTSAVEALVRTTTFKERLAEAIDQLVTENDLTSFNKEGVPKAPVLSKLLKQTVSSQQRDAAWYAYQQLNTEG